MEDQTDLICRFLPDFTIVFVNPAFCRFFMKKEDLLLNQKFLLFLSEKYQDELETKIGELTVDRPVKTHKLELETPNRDISFFHMTIRAIFNRKMEIVEYQVICRDITELMVYFERSQKLLEELQIHHFELKAQNDEPQAAEGCCGAVRTKVS